MDIVRPCKVNGEIVAGKSEIRLAHLDGQVSAVQGIGTLRDQLGIVAIAGELLQHNGILRCAGLIDYIVEGFPALVFLIAVDVQRHPEVITQPHNVRCALSVEIQVLVIPCHLCADEVVPTGGFLVAVPPVSGVVAVTDVVDIGCIVRFNGLPLGLRTLHINGLIKRGGRDGIDALVAADIVDEQVVVVILQLALGRLKVAAELVVKLINQRVVNKAVGTAPRCGLAPCVPFVPAGHEDYHGILLQCTVKLLGEIIAPERRRRPLLLVPIRIRGGVGTTHDVLTVHSGDLVRHVVMVHGNADRDLLGRLVAPLFLGAVIDRLRIGMQPSPLSDIGLTVQQVCRLPRPEGKEISDLTGHRAGVRHQHGLVIQIVPQLLIDAVLIDIIVQRPELGLAAAVVPEGQEEGDLRNLHAVL